MNRKRHLQCPLRFPLLLAGLVLLSACGTFEVGVERASPAAGTAVVPVTILVTREVTSRPAAPSPTATGSPALTKPSSTPTPAATVRPTPTSTPSPPPTRSPLPPTPATTCPPQPNPIHLTVQSVEVSDVRVTVGGEVTWECSPVTRIHWQWGDGQEDDQAFPASHTYAAMGTYSVTATATNEQGATVARSVTVFVGPYVGEMIYIPAGPFQMGCDPQNAAESCNADEQPLHSVTLDGYFIDRYEVTNGRYQACVNSGGCAQLADWSSATRSWYYTNPAYYDYPVINVSWAEAQAYCTWAGERLPGEAEWEKAARGSEDTRMYPWGDETPNCSRLNYQGYPGDCVGDTSLVGGHPGGASPYGLMDLAGNVWEWVSDWYQEDYYSVSPAGNPSGPAGGELKVLRGGSWYEDGSWVRVARRVSDLPDRRYNRLGFRCARSVGK